MQKHVHNNGMQGNGGRGRNSNFDVTPETLEYCTIGEEMFSKKPGMAQLGASESFLSR
jgi:hypothetical protein